MMKRLTKEEKLNILATLKKANRLTAAQSISSQQLTDILTKCQASAITLGEALERHGGEGEAIIRMLEEYCEALYLQSQNYGNEALQREFQTGIDALLGLVEQEIEKLPPDKKVVVFLPYKASMWDSLESVWKAADEDSDCDAYVVPIPYFDRNPDRSFGKMHYEGDQYPDYVPVYSWEEFSIPDMKPDMVFIHNPYDEYNYVTSVHPAFYSKELKKYTKRLVYIPYFNTGGTMADSFERTAAYYHCDYIVVQTEEEKEYLAEDIRYKALTAGSPKYDRIINYQVKADEIPEAWKNKLTGTVLFYNTSISGILQHGEQAIQKMLYVFNTFKESDATLLWRPHPLLKSTIQSMRPDLLELYEKAEDAFNGVKNGILDTGADTILSGKLADAYIGEETSSMVHLFGIQGKPIFLTNVQVVQNWEKEKGNVRIYDCVYENGFYWALCGDWNGLLKIDHTGSIIKIYEIPEEKRDNPRLYNSMVFTEGKLYLVPYTAKAIAVFDIKTEGFQRIPLDIPRKTNFSKAFLYKGNIYMVPTFYKGLLKLECSTGKVTCFEGMVDTVRTLYNNSTEPFSFNGSVLDGNNLLVAATFGNVVVEMNLDTESYQVHTVGNGELGFWCMAGNEGRYVLGSNRGRELACWNKESNELHVLESYPKTWTGEDNCFYDMVSLEENQILVFPKFGNQILEISTEDLQISAFETEEKHSPADRKNEYYSWPSNYLMARKVVDDTVLVQSAHGYGITLLKVTGEAKHLRVYVPEELFPYGYEDLFCRRSKNLPWVMRETNIFSLADFVKYVGSGKHDTRKQIQEYGVVAANLDGTCGEKIYQTIVDGL